MTDRPNLFKPYRRLTAGLIGMVLLASWVTTPSASAALYTFSGAFEGSGADALSSPVGAAADNSTGSSNGDVYVADQASRRVEKFTAAGQFLLMFGKEVDETHGQDVCTAASGDTCKAGLATSSPGGFESPRFIAVDDSNGPSAGDVYVADAGDNRVSKFSPSGNLIASWAAGGQLEGNSEIQGIAVGPTGNLSILANDVHSYNEDGTSASTTTVQYTDGMTPGGIAFNNESEFYLDRYNYYLQRWSSTGRLLGTVHEGEVGGFDVNNSDELFFDKATEESGIPTGVVQRVEPSCFSSCAPLETFGGGHLSSTPAGLSFDEADASVYVADRGNHRVEVFEDTAPIVITGGSANVHETSASISGHVDPAGHGPVTNCYFEYGLSSSYGNSKPCEPSGSYTEPTDVTAELSGLPRATTFHYRLVAENATVQVKGKDETFTTTAAPSIDGVRARNLTPTSADVLAKINPHGLATTYMVEYGVTTAYGNIAPAPPGTLASSLTAQDVEVHLSGLTENVVYHFRVVAANSVGTVAGEDQTFDFYPPSCPNATVRQQTGAETLPDCRAYELVVPPRLGSAIIFTPGVSPDGPYATQPARFAFSAALGQIPGVGDSPNSNVESYVATRTDTGWVTHYVGILGNEALTGENLIGNLSFSKFIEFRGNSAGISVPIPNPSHFAPYVFDFEGNSLGRWPTGVGSYIPNADESIGAWQPSPDFSHLAFSSHNVVFAPGGTTADPGSAYDFNTRTGTTDVISLLPSGADITPQPTPQQSSSAEDPYIEFPPQNGYGQPPVQNAPGVSTDGSHILMSTSPTGLPPAEETGPRPYPVELYMRVDDATTYEVSVGHDVTYVGMTADGREVFFTSTEQLTSEDHDHSQDLYMWSQAGAEAGRPLTLISKGEGGAGNSDACTAEWVEGCGVVPVIGARTTDNSIASGSGDIYFYSPELLDGAKGVENAENLYVYSAGRVRFIAALTPGPECVLQGGEERRCANGPLARIQVSPDGLHAAFITADHVTSAETAGYQEMYSYDSSSEALHCVSCNPDGERPVGNVKGSENGLFMSNDGRTYFYSPDALVPQDTNGLYDVYEYVEGRPWLISDGTAAEDSQNKSGFGAKRVAGLEGVSADGVNVYFSTYAVLVPQDENGAFLKIYDARTNGGFPFNPPAPPCEAADECHGAGSEPPAPLSDGTGGNLGLGGNLRLRRKVETRRHRAKLHRRRKHGTGVRHVRAARWFPAGRTR